MNNNSRPKSNNLNLEDIARLSGVSRSTVSRVINQHPAVKDETRRKVMEVVEQYSFQPNPAARALASHQTQVIGVLIPDIVTDLFRDPFFPALLQAITTSAITYDYNVTLWLHDPTTPEPVFYQRAFSNRLVDGWVIASATVDKAFTDMLIAQEKPYMLVGQPYTPIDTINFVDVENATGAQMIVRHLVERGCQRIGMITGRDGLTSSLDRQRAYLQTLIEADLPADHDLLTPPGNYTEAGGYTGMKYLLARGVDGVFAANDVMALGALRAIQEAGLRVPQDIRIGGFDDMPVAATASLTTIRQPIAALGASAVEGLIGILQGRIEPPYHRLFPVELVVRSST